MLVASSAYAGTRSDYAQQWGLDIGHADGGIYRVVLSRDIYRQAHTPQLRDIEVFNEEGRSLPAVLMAPASESAPLTSVATLPWFTLPETVGSGRSDDIAMMVERNADGSVNSVGVRVFAPGTVPVVSSSWLIDASRMREAVHGLTLNWQADAGQFEHYMDVEGSDDLRTWHVLALRAPLLNLVRNGQSLRHDRIALDSRYRYLRLRLLDNGTLPLTEVRADFAMPAAPMTWQWEELSGARVIEKGREYFEFKLDGRFPAAHADVLLGDNDTRRWTLESRDTVQDPWQTRAPSWIAYAVRMEGQEVRSMPQALYGVSRDRYWRLSSDVPVGNAQVPMLRLGYRPESLVFMAQGEGPYVLAAGSANAVRAPSSLVQTMETLRQQLGPAWVPETVDLSAPETLAGATALTPVVQRDWKNWTLWAVLIAGAALVAGFAFSLLRRSSNGEN
ncbi:MAG: DUF3999 domain-containing protein [Xanthomonadaceae bacterium]|nr:DUF3999 domain-containing protein [Xanthomonadaceae bacterium]